MTSQMRHVIFARVKFGAIWWCDQHSHKSNFGAKFTIHNFHDVFARFFRRLFSDTALTDFGALFAARQKCLSTRTLFLELCTGFQKKQLHKLFTVTRREESRGFQGCCSDYYFT